MIPPLTRTGAAYNTAQFSEKSMDDRMNEIPTMPLGDQADAWGQLDEDMETQYFPLIPTAFRNDLYVFGSGLGNGTGNGSIGAPYYQAIFVK